MPKLSNNVAPEESDDPPFGNLTKIFLVLLLIMFAFGSLTVAFFPNEYDAPPTSDTVQHPITDANTTIENNQTTRKK